MKIKETQQDLAVINIEIAKELFIEKFVSKIREESVSELTPIIGLSVYSQKSKENIAKILDAFLTKPLSIDRFIESVFTSIENRANGCESFNS